MLSRFFKSKTKSTDKKKASSALKKAKTAPVAKKTAAKKPAVKAAPKKAAPPAKKTPAKVTKKEVKVAPLPAVPVKKAPPVKVEKLSPLPEAPKEVYTPPSPMPLLKPGKRITAEGWKRLMMQRSTKK